MKSKISLTEHKQAALDAEYLFEEVDRGLPFPTGLWVLVGLLTLLVLAGCAGTPVAATDFKPTPVTFNIKVAYECGVPPPVSVLSMRDINWEVIEVDGILFHEGANPFTGELVTLTVDDYKLLGKNTSDWIAASKEMKEQRDFYRDCIARSKQDILEDNLDAPLTNATTSVE